MPQSTQLRGEENSDLRARVEQDPQKIRAMFDRISPTYDRLNTLLTCGIDTRWRRRAITALGDCHDKRVLDLCCGTCDMTVAIARKCNGAHRSIVALDFSAEMLRAASAKVRGIPGADKVTLTEASAEDIPLSDESIDMACVAFGIRNVHDVPQALSEVFRVLAPGGRFVILEFSLPENMLIRRLFLAYFRRVLPRIGAWISGDNEAYSYLNRSAENFPHGEEFAAIVRAAGFSEVTFTPLTAGLVTLYVATKSAFQKSS